MYYDEKFFNQLDDGALSSARVIVPLVRDFVPFRSVVDVGCGRGAWLSVFQKNGAERIAGYDGDYVDRDRLLIPACCFHSLDLASPSAIDGMYDLAVCLEVAEHLPEHAATPLVQTLSRLAPIVLFSAAIPGQGGTNHVNEQWPEYWAQLFANNGFTKLDPIRRQIIANPGVRPWYKQNIYIFMDDTTIHANQRYQHEAALARSADVEVVMSKRVVALRSVRGVLGELRRTGRRAIRKRLWK